ncbi:Oxysterol-binding protein [Acephala macrosclerotiorum]|nr:Oxysterol-binding protein [Acephala macrosclerotiorum]
MTHHSHFRDFITFLSTVSGDITNVTAPPFFLAPISVVEVGSCWTERPSIFISATLEPDPEARALKVLQWILCSLRSQFYVGEGDKAGLKKPLNAFLGEIFEGEWTDDTSTARMIAEQVSHHPPITACYMWNDEHQIRGEGYTRVEMSFSGNLNIKQTGHALVHLDKYDEHYLIPMPNCKVRGFLSASLYPELYGTYYLTSSTGFISEITFSGKGFFSGVRNSFEAKMYKAGDKKKEPLYTARGQWNDKFIITDPRGNRDPITCEPGKIPASKLETKPIEKQDSWETRKAWQHVLAALGENNMQNIVKEKTKIEEAQRAMRKDELCKEKVWEPKFFTSSEDSPLFRELSEGTPWKLSAERTKGVWSFDQAKAKAAVKPYHGELTPLGVLERAGSIERKS